MANEITVVASLTYVNAAIGVASASLGINSPGKFTISGSKFVENIFSVPTTAGGTALPIGSVGTLGWALLKNLDTVNFVSILNAVSGTKLLRLNPGEVALFRFDQSVTAPAAIADTAAVLLQYMMLAN